MELSGSCWKCGKVLSGGDYARSESCSGCDSDTRVCRNCGFYDPSVNNQCQEPQADSILHKDRANFCEFFRPASPKPAGGAGGRSQSLKSDTKDAFEALFKKGPGSP